MADDNDDNDSIEPTEPKADAHLAPEARAAEKVAELRMHSELAAIFEGPRKFDAQVIPGLNGDIARDVQRSMAKFERAKIEPTPVLQADVMPEASRILSLPLSAGLPTGDYHIYRRPGEVMIVRWLAGGDETDLFLTRYQAHCDVALEGVREDERSALDWRGDAPTKAYLAALDTAELKVTDLYYREPIRQQGLFVITTTATDEMNIRFLCGHLMGVEVAQVTGEASAPGDDATDGDLAWYFKLFSLRGVVDDVERMCFFAFLQKSDDAFDF